MHVRGPVRKSLLFDSNKLNKFVAEKQKAVDLKKKQNCIQ